MEYVNATGENGNVHLSIHAGNNFMYTLVVVLAEKICKDQGIHPARFSVMLLEDIAKD